MTARGGGGDGGGAAAGPSGAAAVAPREYFLKKRVLQLIVSREVAAYWADPAGSREKGVLKGVYGFVMACPLASTERARAAVAELVDSLPELGRRVHAGTHRDMSKAFENAIVGVMAQKRRTEAEAETAAADALYAWMAAPDDEQGDDEQSLSASKSDEALDAERRRRRLEALATVLADLSTHGDGAADHLFSLLAAHSTRHSLPAAYRTLLGESSLRRRLPRLLRDAGVRAKVRSVLRLVPTRLLLAAFRIANPFRLLTTLARLLLVRPPFARWSPLQHMLATLADHPRTEREADDAMRALPSAAARRLERWAAANVPARLADAARDTDAAVFERDDVVEALGGEAAVREAAKNWRGDELARQLGRPHSGGGQAGRVIVPGPVTATTGTPEDALLLAATRALALHVRLAEKAEYISFIGEPKVNSLLLRLLPLLQAPLVELYSAGDVPKLVDGAIALLWRAIELGDDAALDEAAKAAQFERLSDEMIDVAYSFLHRMALNRKGPLHALVAWVADAWQTADTRLPLHAAMEAVLTAEERAAVEAYGDALAREYTGGGSARAMPPCAPLERVAAHIAEHNF